MIVSRNGNVIFSNVSGPSAETISTIGQTVGQIGSSLTQRQRQFTEVEQKCGKKPKLPGKRRKAWDNCAAGFASTATTSQPTPPPLPLVPKKSNTLLYVGLGVVGLAVIGFIVYKAKNK
jgi:hypothetical protein